MARHKPAKSRAKMQNAQYVFMKFIKVLIILAILVCIYIVTDKPHCDIGVDLHKNKFEAMSLAYLHGVKNYDYIPRITFLISDRLFRGGNGFLSGRIKYFGVVADNKLVYDFTRKGNHVYIRMSSGLRKQGSVCSIIMERGGKKVKVPGRVYNAKKGFSFKLPAGDMLRVLLDNKVVFEFDKREHIITGVIKFGFERGKHTYTIKVVDNNGHKSAHKETINVLRR